MQTGVYQCPVQEIKLVNTEQSEKETEITEENTEDKFRVSAII